MNWSLTGKPVDGCYSIVYADPPWSYKDKQGQGPYPTMDLHDLMALPVEALTTPDAVLFMWATWPTLPDAFSLGIQWGFRYVNCGFLWVKMRAGRPFMGLGHWTRGNTEPCLLFKRGKPKVISHSVEQVVLAPLTRHSAKPPEVRDRIHALMGDQPSVELFAREQVARWDSFGNEIDPATSVLLEAPK